MLAGRPPRLHDHPWSEAMRIHRRDEVEVTWIAAHLPPAETAAAGIRPADWLGNLVAGQASLLVLLSARLVTFVTEMDARTQASQRIITAVAHAQIQAARAMRPREEDSAGVSAHAGRGLGARTVPGRGLARSGGLVFHWIRAGLGRKKVYLLIIGYMFMFICISIIVCIHIQSL